MKKEWELHYEHQRDYQNALLEMQGKPHLIEEKYGVLSSLLLKRVINKGLLSREFSGRKFWPIFKAMGHTSTDFKLCTCRNPK
jgi:hypothetical protein